MKHRYNIKWDNNTKLLNKWKNGVTGIPIVDAGMRQMNITGWMHNRLRLIVSNFLIKILHINWKSGEKYFAQKLIDYDIILNNGNWQWSASTGADSQPYFRIFNPWRQSEKFDINCDYIKKWVPELVDVPSQDIHKWYLTYKYYINKENIKYWRPCIIDLKPQIKKTIKLYKNRF